MSAYLKYIFLVIGYGLYGSIYGKCEYQVVIQVNKSFKFSWI